MVECILNDFFVFFKKFEKKILKSEMFYVDHLKPDNEEDIKSITALEDFPMKMRMIFISVFFT